MEGKTLRQSGYLDVARRHIGDGPKRRSAQAVRRLSPATAIDAFFDMGID